MEMIADIPFGMMDGSSYREHELDPRPGDRRAIVTDGLVERADAAGHLDVAAALLETAALHRREVVHAFKASVVAATAAELGDDASVLASTGRAATRPTPATSSRASVDGRRRLRPTWTQPEGRAALRILKSRRPPALGLP